LLERLNKIKDRMGGTSSMHGEMGNKNKILI